ncbi:glycosyltransferase 87 family protein [Rhodococcus sp. G-MC3]|uniref:glycosyltransferase 87 family protein n=1 Tax=Rhodococcus sp. G-MC3 TaxID=3046209 RepID=UPI0024B94211|nr:glycosyltransferase 87 family protein [Rhodococcus sp. G-MC3]MDJ0393064.1 glycosyltransferase 87 family protein [Rhodococcus sp. G-MC3]
MLTPPDTTADASATKPTPGRSVLPPVAVIAYAAIAVGALLGIAYNIVGLPGLRVLGDYYRIDLDVYRIGGGVFASGSPLYGGMPPTQLGNSLPFTYPPIAAVLFSPLSVFSLYWAGIVVTTLSLVLLFATIVLTLRSLGYAPKTLMLWAAGAVFAASMILEPVFSTLDYGQINIVLMAFVAADCLPRKTPWPRGVLIGFVAAVKLTPAVFVLFFLLRKDFRAAVMTGISFAVFTLLGFVFTFSDSVTYWTDTLLDSDRIGTPAYPANQSITGVLARFGLADSTRSVLWIAASCCVLAVAVIAMRKAFASDHIALALGVNATLGLLISPVSWSHHWVWAVPFLVSLGTLAYRRRNIPVLVFVGVGALVMHFAPHWRLAVGRYSGLGWPVWDQVVASTYVWWGIAALVIVTCITGRTTAHSMATPASS